MQKVPVLRRWPVILATGLAWCAPVRADVLTISAPAGQPVQITLQGAANKDYAIQTTADLASGTWATLDMGATDAAGILQDSDTAPGAAPRFYRAARLPGLETTTDVAATVPGNTVFIVLGGSDPLNPGGTLSAVITQLPANGTLEQMNGTPITAAGTVVSDSQNRVQFIPAAGAVNPASGSYAVFAYELKRASNGVTSAPQTVAVSLAANWVFSSFDDATQALELAYSLDGLHWSDTGDLYTAPAGNGVRDSSILKMGGAYYIAYTAGNFGSAEYFQICQSTDLVHWTYLCDVNASAAGYSHFTWAPEWFVDRDGTVYLYISRSNADSQWHLLYATATSADLTQWTAFQNVGGDMPSRGAIDPQVVRVGGTYYVLYRNYGAGGNTDCIEMARGTSPTAFTLYKTGNWAGWGTPREGPSLVPLGGSNWRIYFVLADGSFIDGSHVVSSDSTDGMATWSAPVGMNVPQHGTCYALDGASGTDSARISARPSLATDRALPTANRPAEKPVTPECLPTSDATFPSRGSRTP